MNRLRSIIREMIDQTTPVAVLTVGIPGSGKSTEIERRFSGIRVISPDNYILNAAGQYDWTPDRAQYAWKRSFRDVREAIENNESFVFDATFISRKSRKPLLKILRDTDYRVIALQVTTDPRIAIERNNMRTDDRRVPDETMASMIRRYSAPTTDEGFDEVIEV